MPNFKSAAKAERDRAQADLLARAFLDILARDTGAHSKSMLRAGSGDPSDPVEIMLDDLMDTSLEERVSVRPDIAALAVLTARAIEAEPGLTRILRRGAPVVTVATHTSDRVAPVRTVFEACALPGDRRAVAKMSRDARPGRPEVLMIARDGTEKNHKPDNGNEEVANALHARSTIVGIAPDTRRYLPRDLIRSAEYHLVLPDMDVSALAVVIEAVTGKRASRDIDPNAIRSLDISDLVLALRPDRSPDDCILRLEELVRKKGEFHSEGPSLVDLEGYGAAKEWGLQLAADLADYRAGRIGWEDVDNRGLLLSGPPGVGKTSYARALAKSAQVPLVATSVADWTTANYLSGTLQAIKDAFTRARQLAPCILFIDELDGISDRARLRGDYVEYWSQIVNLFLELLQGVDERPGVVVIGATNQPDMIDPAVKRAGRLDREIEIERPDALTLAKIFRHYLRDLLPDADLLPAALIARGCTGADVEAFVRRARGAARRARRPLEFSDLLQEVRSDRMPPTSEERRRIAIHEAGHAVAAGLLGGMEVVGVAIGDWNGVTRISHVEASASMEHCQKILTMLMAGRAAEELALGSASAGAGGRPESDLSQATELAKKIELQFGFGQFGPLYLPDGLHDPLTTIQGLLPAVGRRLAEAMAEATALLIANRTVLDAVAEALDSRGYLAATEISALIASRYDGATIPRPSTNPANESFGPAETSR